MYRVIEYFEDLQDDGRSYNVGDVFPYGNKTVTDERLAELSSNKNRRRIPLIKKVDEPKVEKPKNLKYQCLVLWRKVFIPSVVPKLPPKKATKKAVVETEK